MPDEVVKQYKEILQQYVDGQHEEDLYLGQQFSRRFIENEISPEEVISIHKTALARGLNRICRKKLWHSFDFLIEMMIHYGLALKRASESHSETGRTSNGNECSGKSTRYATENKNTGFQRA